MIVTGSIAGDRVDQSRNNLIVATLCDEPVGLTCSIDAARNGYRAHKIVFCETFEVAAGHVKNNGVDALLVPGAYPGLNAFIMDSELEVFDCFIRPIPSLVYASSPDTAEDDIKSNTKLYFHPAVGPLMNQFASTIRARNYAPVTSNSEACKKMLAHSDVTVCITNQLCASHYGLRILRVLRVGLVMPWVLLRRRAP